MSPPFGTSQPSLEEVLRIYEVYRDYLKHEDDLRSTRTGWLLTSQAFLFAAVGTVLTAKEGPVLTISFFVELFIAILGFAIALNHRQRANQQDEVYDSLEENYCKVRKRFSADLCDHVALSDLPALRYGDRHATIGARSYSASYHTLFMVAWGVLVILLTAGHFRVPIAMFAPSPDTTLNEKTAHAKSPQNPAPTDKGPGTASPSPR